MQKPRSALNGVVKTEGPFKMGPFKIVDGKFRAFNTPTMAKRVPLKSELAIEQSSKEAGGNQSRSI